jgi:hypothetical protein
MPFEYRDNQGRVYDYCVYRVGDDKPMQCFETAEEAQAYWMALTIGEQLPSQATAEDKELAQKVKQYFKDKRSKWL